MIKLHSLVIVT